MTDLRRGYLERMALAFAAADLATWGTATDEERAESREILAGMVERGDVQITPLTAQEMERVRGRSIRRTADGAIEIRTEAD